MSEAVVKEIIERAIKDEAFRKLLFSNPDEALQSYNLTEEDRKVLENLNEDNFDEFAGGLGDRSTKGSWVIGT
ncbi:MAG: hypothetical protein H6659_16770 [Ardenticatenaceae bacterium]|nr:hypothetical protein [Ardenticatenaceae bacterium]MCB8988252.1 hypothetical protein [Ardenticatenaceae bacterium]